MLIDIRHECSHRDLPSLRLARVASTKALEWLKSNYWEPQRMAIPYPSDRTANLRKDVKYTLRELAFGLDIKQTTQTSSSPTKRKRSQKQITKALKRFVQLYSSSSSEVLSLLVESLLKALDPLDLAVISNSSQVDDNARRFQTLVDDWKPIIMKVSNKEPEILLNLLKTVLLMMETQEALAYESGGKQSKSEGNASSHQIKQLSCLFEWLVDNLKELNHVHHKASASEVDGSMKERKFSKSALINLLYKCLLVSSPHNNNLTAASLKLARMVGNNALFEKINTLTALHTSNIENDEESPPSSSYETFLSWQEATISQAAKKLEFLTQKLEKKNSSETTEGNTRKERWTVAKSWNSCPIGMLPSEIGSSGRLPVLDSTEVHDEPSKLLENEGECELNQHLGKREAECFVEDLDNSEVKKMKESGGNEEEDTLLDGITGRLMIGGVWKCVTEEEVDAISSSVRILV